MNPVNIKLEYKQIKDLFQRISLIEFTNGLELCGGNGPVILSIDTAFYNAALRANTVNESQRVQWFRNDTLLVLDNQTNTLQTDMAGTYKVVLRYNFSQNEGIEFCEIEDEVVVVEGSVEETFSIVEFPPEVCQGNAFQLIASSEKYS